MKKIFLPLLMMFLGLTQAFAQQRGQSSFDHFNLYNLNNARAGLDSCIHAFAQHKQQWVGVKGAPANTQIQAHMPIGSGMGVGVEIANWNVGLLSATNFAATFAKHFNVTDKYRLSGALSLGFYQYSFGGDNVVVFDNDNYLDQSKSTAGGIYGDLGVMFSSDELEVGISIPSIFSTAPSIQMGAEMNEFNVERYLNAHASYDFDLNSDFELTPMLIYRSIPGSGAVVDMKAGLRYRNMLGLNLGYRTQNGLMVAVDYTFMDRFKLGYAYDAGMTQLNGISNGSHEFLLGFQLCKAQKEKEPKKEKQTDYYLRGKVSDAENATGLNAATVELKNLTDGSAQTVTTDADGNYVAEVVNGAKYELTAKDGDHEVLKKSITIEPANPNAKLDMALAPNKLIAQGKVMDTKTGKPLSGVAVELSQDQESYKAVTDADGRFSLNLKDKKAGDLAKYNFKLSKPGYVTKDGFFSSTISDYSPIQLDALIEGGIDLSPKPTDAKTRVTPKEQPVEKEIEMIALKPILYEVSSPKLTNESVAELDKVVAMMQANKSLKVAVESHTDCTGGEAGNQRLSDARAKSVVDYIKAKITNPERISGKGFGESSPITTCECTDCAKADHEKNRRTEFKIVK
jgi:type IX secretion system PorP/SprF family membrane protein